MSEQKEAVLYARVSSKKQEKSGSGLQSQLTRCHEYARFKNYEVLDEFTDDMTGRVSGRPGMKRMLAFLRQHRNKTITVIIDDITRWARHVDAHRELKKSVRKAGGVLESPTFDFGEDADSVLIENLLASVSQHNVDKNAERVVSRMRARMLGGFAVFHPPPGYRWNEDKAGGKVYIPDEPAASVLREGLEGFAAGRLTTQAEVKRFLENHPAYPSPTGRLSPSTIRKQLESPLYAGYIEYEPWGVSLREARHEALISYATHLKIQDRLAGRSYAPTRKNLKPSFALTGFVVCGDCDAPLRSCYSKGRSKHYPYYLCQTKGCDSYGKSIQRDKLEGDFETLLRSLAPSRVMFETVTLMLKDIWEQRCGSVKAFQATLRKDLQSIEDQIGSLVDRVLETQSPALISAYEGKIKRFEKEKVKTAEKLEHFEAPRGDFNELTRTAFAYLSSPWNLWKNGQIEDKRAVLRLTFSGQLAYSRIDGFRTAEKEKLSLPFRLLGNLRKSDCGVVEPGGIEPPTSCMPCKFLRP